MKHFEQLNCRTESIGLSAAWGILRHEILLDPVFGQFGGLAGFAILAGIGDVDQHLRWVIVLHPDFAFMGEAYVNEHSTQRTILLGVLVNMAKQEGGQEIDLGKLVIQCLNAHVLQGRNEENVSDDPEICKVFDAWNLACTILNLLIIDPCGEDAESLNGDCVMDHRLARTL